MEIFFVFWVLVGIAAAIVITNKGYPAFDGFVLGFLLGPIGLIIALVMAADDQGVEENALASGNLRKCPYCAELIKVEAIKCRHCGSNVAR